MDLFGEPDKEEAVDTPAEEETQDIAPTEEQGLDNPKTSSLCFGHDSVEKAVLEQFNSGRMPHGIILSGPKGIGKATFAYRLARFLLKNKASDPNQDALFGDTPAKIETLDTASDDQVFRQVASGGHPDFLSIERAHDSAKDETKGNIGVNDIRKVTPFLRMTASYEGGRRVVIVDDADTMNRNAQNALLKILEEPPEDAYLILVSHRLGAMIPTIRSRTQTLTFKPLTKDVFEKLLSMKGFSLDPAQLDTIYNLSEGSVGLALQIMEQGGLDTLALILAMFDHYPHWSWPDIHVLADQMARGGRDQSYKSFIMLLPWMFTQMIQAKARGQTISSKFLQIDTIQNLHKQSSLESLLKICENLKNHFERVDRANLDKRQAVLGAFSIISA